MKTLNFSIFINAPSEKVWNTMLEKSTYEEWTSAFNSDSTFEGDWSLGSKMHFLGSDPDTDEVAGMVSLISERRENEFMSLEHIGEISDGEEQLWEDDMTSFENYTFVEKDGGTEVQVELTNVDEEYIDWMNDLWPKALKMLKNLSENDISATNA